jgi:hypothetical protein
MSVSDRGKLGEFLKEVIHWDWAEFCVAEKDQKYSGLQATVFSLVRTASDGKLGAIKLAIDRVDGKLETPIEVIYPKVYFVYPHAEHRALPPPSATSSPVLLDDIDALNEPPQADDSEEESARIASMSLRQTLEKLADSPRKVTDMILVRKKEIEQDPESYINTDSEDVAKRVPLVKSIIAANLMNLAVNGRNKFEAITEVFDQIDGKLVETYHVLGEDVYLTQYALEAPYNAELNKDGVYQLEQPMISDMWERKLEASRSGKKGTR